MQYRSELLKSILIGILMLSSLQGAECPRYEDMIIVQSSTKVKKYYFVVPLNKDVKQIKIITQSNPYLKEIFSLIKDRRSRPNKVQPQPGWKYFDGITFCFAKEHKKNFKIYQRGVEHIYIYHGRKGYTGVIKMEPTKIKKLYDLIDMALGKKQPTKQNQAPQKGKAK